MNNERLGLFRLMDSAQQERVEREFGVAFADLFNTLDDARDLARDLEQTFNRLFYGSEPVK